MLKSRKLLVPSCGVAQDTIASIKAKAVKYKFLLLERFQFLNLIGGDLLTYAYTKSFPNSFQIAYPSLAFDFFLFLFFTFYSGLCAHFIVPCHLFVLYVKWMLRSLHSFLQKKRQKEKKWGRIRLHTYTTALLTFYAAFYRIFLCSPYSSWQQIFYAHLSKWILEVRVFVS